MTSTILVVLVIFVAHQSHGYLLPSTKSRLSRISAHRSPESDRERTVGGLSRSLTAVAKFSARIIVTSMALPAVAAEKSDSKKFETCMSKCIYAQTREAPIGSEASRLEAKPRAEIVATCKDKCYKKYPRAK